MLRITRRNYSLNLADFEPHSVVKVIQGTKKIVKETKEVKVEDDKMEKLNNKRNPMGIQMISENLYRQIFGNSRNLSFNSEVVEKYRRELAHHGISNLETPLLPDVELKLPKLTGKNIEEHFYNIAKQQVEAYQNLIVLIISANIPKLPEVIIIIIIIMRFKLNFLFRYGHLHLDGLAMIQRRELIPLITLQKIFLCLMLKSVCL